MANGPFSGVPVPTTINGSSGTIVVPTGTIVPFVLATTAVPFTNQPAALTELSTALRTKADLTGFTRARVSAVVSVVGAAAAVLAGQYSLDGTTWFYLDGSTGPSIGIAVLALRTGAWVNLATAAKTDVFLRIVGTGGDGLLDPSFTRVSLEFT